MTRKDPTATPTGHPFDLRSAALIGGAALLGAAWSWVNLQRAGGSGAGAATAALIWTVFATPFFTFWGWFAARRSELWMALFVCGCIYFFSIFAGARIERLLLDAEPARATGHALYFRLTPALQLLACLALALHRGRRRGTMPVPTRPTTGS
ncbi:hypothetical protein [Kallotenue papyrolyticum]|uniref:hypothetical protein n=1 Tax=Kallotenue papyrolyticum TaxID=1325125 RepID=UPI0004923AEF|nr:hypothetical protein [Kallotenue papyrolyticum]